jgi:septal ring factor EnvC (AmiA/AmiB activator)
MEDDVKKQLKEFLELDDQIKQAETKLKEIRSDIRTVKERHKELSEVIKKYMKDNEKDRLMTNKGTICIKESQRVTPLKKDDLAEFLNEQFNDSYKACQVAEEIWNSRKKSVKYELKREE